MGAMYSVTESTATALGTIGDLFEIKALSQNPIWIHSIEIGQTTLEGDTNTEIAHVALKRATGAGVGGVATPIPVPLEPGMEAFGGTVMWNATTDATGLTVVREATWNTGVGWLYVPTPEERILVTSAAGLVISNEEVVAAATLVMAIVFEELKAV